LLLVPSQPGIFALAEEIGQPANDHSRRMLAVFEVEQAEDLSRAMSRLFAMGSPWREKLSQARCYVRYAITPSIADRNAATFALKNWLHTQREVASQMFEPKPIEQPAVAAEQKPMPVDRYEAVEGTELKTMAERAVDRVTHGMQLSKPVPAGF
jgi:hypothetical protein